MRRIDIPFSRPSSCLAVLASFGLVALTGFAAAAQQPAQPAPVVAPAPAPAPVVAAPPPPVVAAPPAPAPVVVAPQPAPAPASSPVIVTHPPASVVVVQSPPAPAPPPANNWVIQPIEPAPPQPTPAPAPATIVMPDKLRVDLHPHPMAPPSPEVIARSRLNAERSRARGLAIAGWVILGASYGTSALVGTITLDVARSSRRLHYYGGWMLIPVGGPFVSAFHAKSATAKLFTASLGIAQAAGLAMALVGGVRHRRLKRQLSIAAAPTPGGGGAVSMAMRF